MKKILGYKNFKNFKYIVARDLNDSYYNPIYGTNNKLSAILTANRESKYTIYDVVVIDNKDKCRKLS